MSASPMRREAPFAAALASLLLLTLAPAASAAETFGARRTVYYQDAACRLESFREYAYSARSMETDHTTREVAFGECYARGSTGAITTCDPVDGTSTVETYLDTKCQQHLYSSRESPECENLRVDGHSCPAGGPASATSDCASMSIYPTITPGAFNLVGSPYNDRMCEDRAGGDHIVPGEAFGVGNIGCTLSTLVRGPLFSLTECMDDGTVYGKVFGPDDINCSGELHNEVLMFPRAAQTDMTGGICALGVFEDGRREYYRLKACTTKAETPKEPISVTPAPTAHAEMIFFDDDQTNGQPAPVDYRGDGDDEDLRDDSDDDGSSSYHDSGDGKGSHEDRVSEGGSDSKDKDSDDDSGDDHPHEKDHDDHDCDDDHKKDSDDSLSMDHGWRSDDDSGDKHHHHHRDGSSSGDDSTGDDYHHHHGDDDHHDSHHHGDGSDDDDVHSSNGDGSGQGDGGSPHGSADDDGHGHGHGDSDDHGDGGSEERDDDDLDANASGRGGDVDGDGDDGLTGNGVFAIVFGVAVSFAICLLSFVLATTGDNRQKVGPKT